MKILLTGGSGFLGSALALHLHTAGHQVALLLRPGSRLDRLGGHEQWFDIGRCSTDAEIAAFVHKVGADTVVHAACSYGRRGESIMDIADSNVRLGLTLLQALENSGKSTVFLNTGTVLAPDVSPYALSKQQFAQWGRSFAAHSTGKLQFINVLLQHMFGPNDDASKFTTHVLRACYRNEPELKLTAGEQQRDFIYIDDVVSAYALLLARAGQLDQVLDVEVGTGVAPSVRAFVETAHRITNSQTRLQFGALAYRANEAMHCKADTTFMKTLGWNPIYDLEAGLKKTIELEF